MPSPSKPSAQPLASRAVFRSTRPRRLALAALLAAVVSPVGSAVAQTFYGCSPQGNCERVLFSIATVPNVRGNFQAMLHETLYVAEVPGVWVGTEVTFSGGMPLIGAGPDHIDHPFPGTYMFDLSVPGPFTPGPMIAYFDAPAVATSAALLIEERPVGAPPGVLQRVRVPLTLIAPPTTVPEPTTVALVGGGLALIAGAMRRRR